MEAAEAGEEDAATEVVAEATCVEEETTPINAEAAEDGMAEGTAPRTKKLVGTARDAATTVARPNVLRAEEGKESPENQEDHHPTNPREVAKRTRLCGRTRTAATRR